MEKDLPLGWIADEVDEPVNMNLNITSSHGTKRLYGTVYPQDYIGVGFNTRFGGYYVSLRGESA